MRYLVLLFVITAAMACQKEVTGDPPDPTTPAGPRLLTKYIYNQEKKYWTDTFSFDQQNQPSNHDRRFSKYEGRAAIDRFAFSSQFKIAAERDKIV